MHTEQKIRLWGVTGGLGILALIQPLWKEWYLTSGVRHGSPAAIGLATALAASVALPLACALWPTMAQKAWPRVLRARRYLGRGRWILLALWATFFPYLVIFSPRAGKFASINAHWWLYFVFALGAFVLLASEHEKNIFASILQSLLLTGSVFAFAAAYVNVSSYPLSLTWSEGNRLWDYSLMFGRDRYLYPADQPIFAHISAGRQFLWGLVYLIPNVGICGVRLWSAMLFTVPYLLFGWAVFGRPAATRKAAFWAGLWAFLFLRQGPIYTPLLLSAFMIVLAEGTPWGIGMLLAALAGYFAAITRYTWLFAPAAWGVLWALAHHLLKEKHTHQWLRQAMLWGGSALAGALLTNDAKTFFSTAWGIAAKHLGGTVGGTTTVGDVAVRQPLIWSRLCPNPTFQPGIAGGFALALAPVAALWWIGRRRGWWRFSRSEGGIISLILTLFLAIGLIASLKIGGGSNLHNFDMFLVSVIFVTALAWRKGGGRWLQNRQWEPLEEVFLSALVIVPMYFVFLAAPIRHIPERAWWEPALQKIQYLVHEANESDKEVLFMDQRQLLTFGFVEPLPLVPDYEKKWMMDKAMAGDADYFAQYYHDLAKQRFAYIISFPLRTEIQAENAHNFAAENNAWVRWVAAPTLCYYEPIATFPAAGVQILTPRKDADCTDILPVLPAP